ncbi:MAG: Asp-tRNA(Asn)/Glu-tRNA(Gln) amidotransferase subunit GatB [Victivallaceae bacterium]|nr:Asp-tRNA(Asn)/Glu-tRNA(Gln) amidotransferase subunit GatB [Victivallaceae bacterium]MDD4181014.1 Asp-tRNA(Asn)/Glu-tRNA(Gln) amidotransferase subunit GatB [Victivallaceae bacterium]
MPKYEAVIGLETHVQVKTASKMFCACPNQYGAPPNTLTCPVCMGFPGALPMPNKQAIRKTAEAGMLLNCTIAPYSKFDRKNYFYADMAKGFQISQLDQPLCLGGKVRIGGTGFSGSEVADREVHLNRIHLEEDVAKLSHQGSATIADFNRCSVPLMEIVTEPDLDSADEVYSYLVNLKQILQYGNISDCDQEKGQMRCDVNVSLRLVGDKELGIKAEIKNLNSIRAAHRAVEYEIWRQTNELEAGNTIVQETRGWNDDTGESYSMRSKETVDDYRYFPEPDLMPILLDDAYIAEIRAALPELPEQRRARFIADFALTEYDAQVLTQDKALADYFEVAAALVKTPKILANWILSELLRELSSADGTINECLVTPQKMAGLMILIEDNTINGKIGKTVLTEMLQNGQDAKQIVEQKGLVQVTDQGAIEALVLQVITENPTQVEQYQAGNPKVIQYLVGQLMKLSKGKANPQMAIQLLKEKMK